MFTLRAFFSCSLALCIALGTALTPLGRLWAAPFRVGDTVPAATPFTDEQGTPHTLGEYTGKLVVLEWMNADCPFTQKHYSHLNIPTLQKIYIKQGVVWLSVSSSAEGKQGFTTPQNATATLTKLGGTPTHLILDASGTLGHAFGADTTPFFIILNKHGKIAYRGAIDSVPSFDAADIPHAVNYVRNALDNLLAEKPVSLSQTRSYGCSIKY